MENSHAKGRGDPSPPPGILRSEKPGAKRRWCGRDLCGVIFAAQVEPCAMCTPCHPSCMASTNGCAVLFTDDPGAGLVSPPRLPLSWATPYLNDAKEHIVALRTPVLERLRPSTDCLCGKGDDCVA